MFAEHSNQLWNISGVDSWSKVNAGLIKMYKAEVNAPYFFSFINYTPLTDLCESYKNAKAIISLQAKFVPVKLAAH